jgi:hypothetical protein
VHHYQWLVVLLGLPNIDNSAHNNEKLLQKVNILYSELNVLMYYIIVQVNKGNFICLALQYLYFIFKINITINCMTYATEKLMSHSQGSPSNPYPELNHTDAYSNIVLSTSRPS